MKSLLTLSLKNSRAFAADLSPRLISSNGYNEFYIRPTFIISNKI